MKRIVFAAALGLGIAYAASATPIEMSTVSGVYTQTFDSLPSSGSPLWVDDSTLAGWYAQRTGAVIYVTATTGSATTGSVYSTGSSGSGERALGALNSNASGDFAFGVQFHNSSGFVITNLSIGYWGEQWRNGGAGVSQTDYVSYATSSSAITALSPTTNAGWTLTPALDFRAPTFNGASGVTLDGNVASNRTWITGDIALTLANNDYIMIRWRDINSPGNDHMLAIDQVGIAWTAIPEPTTVAMLGLFPVVAVLRRVLRRREP